MNREIFEKAIGPASSAKLLQVLQDGQPVLQDDSASGLHLRKAFALGRQEERLRKEADDLEKKSKPEKSLSEKDWRITITNDL